MKLIIALMFLRLMAIQGRKKAVINGTAGAGTLAGLDADSDNIITGRQAKGRVN